MTLRQPNIDRLMQLGLSGMAEALEEQRDIADVDQLGFDDRLALMIEREAEHRDHKSSYEGVRSQAAKLVASTAYRVLSELAGSAAGRSGSERFLHRSRACARTQLLSGWLPTAVRRNHPPIPLAAGTAFRRRGPSIDRRISSPTLVRPHATRPSAGRVRPDWNTAVSGSGDPGARRHETDLGEPPERYEKLAGKRYDHHPTDTSPAACGSLFKPFAQRTLGLMAQPAPRHLNE